MKPGRTTLPFRALLTSVALGFAVSAAAPAWAEEARIAIDLSQAASAATPPTWRVDQGAEVELVVRAEKAGELHLHGYDLHLAVGPDEPAVLRFQASVAGRFPLTRHGAGEDGHGHDRPIGYLEIYPN